MKLKRKGNKTQKKKKIHPTMNNSFQTKMQISNSLVGEKARLNIGSRSLRLQMSSLQCGNDEDRLEKKDKQGQVG